MLHIIQTFDQFSWRDRRGGVDALCLVWRFIPVTIITWEEFIRRFENVLSLNHLTRIRSFYQGIIGETLSSPEPKPLEQNCRVAIRKTLSKNFQLPVEIS
ncbi:hypothetical protein AVEN_4332-1 [Araneus ventricosus]|uniref:Uncharacterized protein n=1 Tax=Araneus ventricosus TaxID=182803 RepID=A0A4Y2KXS3_ARAVE|nr:hypothetical protein AVEN_4332-1 [Araneus ventricosus]